MVDASGVVEAAVGRGQGTSLLEQSFSMGQICLLGHLPHCLMWMARVVHHRNQSEKILVSAMNYKEITVR